MKAIIMAGGEGSRLRPLTCNMPKPMMPILGKPVMEYAVELLKKYGITEIGVTLQYLPDEIVNYFGDGSDFGVNMRYFVEDVPLGTAGSVKNAESFLNETFIVISGDALTDIDISKVINYHNEKEALATLVLKEVAIPLEYGVVVTGKDGFITSFLEKPSWNEVFSDKVNTGIYILEPKIFSFYETNQKFDFSNDLFPILLRNNEAMYGFAFEGFWCDIGNIEQYMNCNYNILKGNVKVSIKAKEVEEGIWIGEECIISPNAVITPPVYIGNNCRIYEGSRVGPYSVIGKNNIISSGSSIKRSIVFNNCYLGSGVELKGTVICNKVQMESRSAAFEESAIGDETFICSKAIVKPGVKVWPEKVVESGVIVKTNLIWGGKHCKSIFAKKLVRGEINIDITPEFVSKLGSAYGSLLPIGSKVAISSSDYGAPQMFKYALATGLLSIGVEVFDLKMMTTSITRHASNFFGVQGAIHVMQELDDRQKVSIKFMDGDGIDLDSQMERKIENSLLREDFRRVMADSLQKISHYTDCVDYYTRHIINKIDTKIIASKKIKVVVSVREKTLTKILKNICEELRISLKFYDVPKDIVGLAKTVVLTNANIGMYIGDSGEDVIVIDGQGNIIRESLYEALKAIVILKSSKLKIYAAPVSCSMSLEKVVNNCGGKFVRTKTGYKDVFNGFLLNEPEFPRKYILEWYLITVDELAFFLVLINYMAKNSLALKDIVSTIPRFVSRKIELSCPWNIKGKVMRRLIEENEQHSIDLTEGVKLSYDNSWALVLLDEEEPICRIYAESDNKENLESIVRNITSRIENITK